MFNISTYKDITGERYGLHFIQGTAKTSDAFLAGRLRNKGYSVTEDILTEDIPPEETEEKISHPVKKSGGRKKNTITETEQTDLTPGSDNSSNEFISDSENGSDEIIPEPDDGSDE